MSAVFTGLVTHNLYRFVTTVAQCCERWPQIGRRTKINWTKTAHNTQSYMHTHAYTVAWCRYIHTHTHAHTVVSLRVEPWAY